VTVDDGLRDVDELSISLACLRAEQFERLLFSDRVAFHQDPFRPFGDRAASEGELAVDGGSLEHGVLVGSAVLLPLTEALDDPDTIWVTEAWADRAAHGASLQEEAAKALIERARPLIAEFADRAEFRPEGGKGLSPHSS